MGDESTWAAEAAECAGDQNSYWEYHDFLFSHQSGENQGTFSKDNLKKFAVDLKLNTEEFNQCLDSGKYTQFVQNQASYAHQFGISSTPTFIIYSNGAVKGVVGPQSFDYFKQIIDAMLNQ